MRRFIVIATVGLLAGCMIGPDYRRPAVDLPDAFRYSEKEALDTANPSWWQQFQDPVLDSLIAEALENNKNVKIATANIEYAAGILVQTRAPLFPQVGYGGNAARQRASESNATPLPPTLSNPQTALSLFAGATWEIGDLGDRPVGPHPATIRSRAGEPARLRRGTPWHNPFPCRRRGGQLSATPRPG